MSLFARLETALAAIEARRMTDITAAAADVAADRARLERIEQAAADAVRALDTLIGQE